MLYGFDIGGTKIEFGAFDSSLRRIATERVATPINDYNLLIETIHLLIKKHDQIFDEEGTVGIGLPGIEHPETGLILTVNVPAANNKALKTDLEKTIGRKVLIENDANCFALSEAWDTSLQHHKCIAGLILGTGFGGGLVLDGEIFTGSNHVSGEVGHVRLPIDAWFHLGSNPPLFTCGCGNKGCMDNYLSGRGFEQLYLHYYGEQLSAVKIIKNYNNGDSQAIEFVDRFMELLAICFANLCTAIDPDVIVLGGGLSNFDLIYQEIPIRMQKHLLSVSKPPQILKAKHGDSGGVRGAAFLHLESNTADD
ncbi:N-acetylglucosamine kinase [Vibrio sp. SS-MA-C1-2]|uniref:N-acetylglucosamine kinase n=1 Tax=Vibrio sp. SS-MA-C1-2 TaxID=2908646 RepID=UPI001F34E374|nr:N-acetylglucosamine kinase [Vibrio sp. SS-MA-C1-2]UJF17616.1 N-acetylglucosamine kinase [Vibrio sp. SS-MA-C1-2]